MRPLLDSVNGNVTQSTKDAGKTLVARSVDTIGGRAAATRVERTSQSNAFGAPPLRGVGLSCFASSPIAALRVSTLTGFHPSREQPAATRRDEWAGCAGGADGGGPSRGRGSRARGWPSRVRDRHLLRSPLDELARCSRTALRKLRFRALRSCQIVTPATRHARSRAA